MQNKTKTKLQELLDQGWELDLFSTFLSRKAEQHKLLGPFCLCRNPRKPLPILGGLTSRFLVEFFNKEV